MCIVGRQKVKAAVKLFSRTTSVALQRCITKGYCSDPDLFLICSELIQLINDWFDVFNSESFNDTRPLKRPYGICLPEQDAVLHTMLTIIPLLYENGKLKPFQKAIIGNCKVLPLLFSYLKEKYGIQYIFTRKLDQDVTENFFSAVRQRGGLSDHPSALEFKYRLRSLLLGILKNAYKF